MNDYYDICNYLRTPYFSVIWTDVELSLVTDNPLIIGIDQER
jgi:hypothetical protein